MIAEAIEQLAGMLLDRDRIVLTTHMTPDGDGLGSEVALLRCLRRRGKNVRIINCSSTPADLRFLLRPKEVTTFVKGRHDDVIKTASIIVAFDLGAAGRLGRMERPIRESHAHKVVVDHHRYDNDLFDHLVLDVRSSSSAEITLRLIDAIGETVDREVAEPLYVGIVQDTGSFNYDATSPATHRAAARLLEAGVNPQRIWKKLNCQKPLGRVRFMGFNIARIAVTDDGRIASVKIDLDAVRRHGVEPRDAFEVINHLLSINRVEVGLLALQLGSRKVKFSLRSAGRVDVCTIAKEYKGGGHRYAAGCTVEGLGIEAAYQTLLDRVRRAVDEAVC